MATNDGDAREAAGARLATAARRLLISAQARLRPRVTPPRPGTRTARSEGDGLASVVDMEAWRRTHGAPVVDLASWRARRDARDEVRPMRPRLVPPLPPRRPGPDGGLG